MKNNKKKRTISGASWTFIARRCVCVCGGGGGGGKGRGYFEL